MKKALVLLAIGTLVLGACQKEPQKDTPSKDSELTGEKVDVSGISKDVKKVFVLSEGSMGSNNATLDFLRISDGNYITGAFKKMNPDAAAGLGDVGNDIVIIGDEAWIVVNNSGIVEVISAKDETEIAAIQVPTPRRIAFDDQYAYVTSWAGAYTIYTSDPKTNTSSITDYSNPKGQVYRINLKTKKVEGIVQVGYQPEGIAYYDGKLYVANSGGISSQLPPNYAYDNTISMIETDKFTTVKLYIEVKVNLKDVYSDGKGNIYVTTLGDYWSTHSGLYMLNSNLSVKAVTDYVSTSAILGDTVYVIGTDTEWDWNSSSHVYKAYSVKNGTKTEITLPVSGTPYGLAAIDSSTFLVADAGDYFNPGTVSCISNGAKAWTVTTGVCPGHFAIY